MAYDRLVILDEQARIFTAKAAGVVSGGDLVEWNSGTDVVGSVSNTYAWNDIAVIKHSGAAAALGNNNVVGVAMYTAASGTEVAVITEGIVVLPAGSNGVTGGAPVIAAGYLNSVEYADPSGAALHVATIGRALSAATAQTGFAIVKLSL